jgi:hypothetical protein
MRNHAIYLEWLLLAAIGLAISTLDALAALPPPSPAQAQAAAAKKAQADAEAEQEKARLAATIDRVSTRWNQRAASEGYKIVPPTALAASAPIAPVAASDVTPPEAGIPAAAPQNAAPGTKAAAPATGAAPRSVHALRSAEVPIKSEKLGTARPSEDVKRAPTPSLPRGAAPTVNKKGVPDDAGKK